MLGRVTEREVFRRFSSEGVRSRSGPITLVRLPRPDGPPSAAFAVSRKVGTAVVRNRVRRQLRTVFRDLSTGPTLGSDAYLVIPGPNAVGASMTTLRGWVERAVERSTPAPAPDESEVRP